MLPIGGVAELDRIPRNPQQEWVIALAGPAVNLLIVGTLFPLVSVLHGSASLGSSFELGAGFLHRLLWVNVGLVVFNLLPAFPMDGGRLFRATLAMMTDYVTATRWAKGVGQAVALLFVLVGVWVNPMLILVAGFIFLAAEAEYQLIRREAADSMSGPCPFARPLADAQQPNRVVIPELVWEPELSRVTPASEKTSPSPWRLATSGRPIVLVTIRTDPST